LILIKGEKIKKNLKGLGKFYNLKNNYKFSTVQSKMQNDSLGHHYTYRPINKTFKPIYIYYTLNHFDAILKLTQFLDLEPANLAFEY